MWQARDTATVSEGHTPAHTMATAHHITPYHITAHLHTYSSMYDGIAHKYATVIMRLYRVNA